MCKKVISFFLLFGFICVFSIPAAALDVSARSAVLISQVDGRVLYEKNASQKLPMASTTKIMTALIVAEHCKMDDMVTVVPEALRTEGSSMYLKAGEIVSVETLLYGLLHSSGNDAANMLAIHISGSIQDFVVLMNEKAQKMGLENTHFDTPSGLDGKTHYSTALDMAKIMSEVMRNQKLAEIMSCKSKSIGGRTFFNHNRLLSLYDYADGGKTGFTKKSGRCLVSSACKDGLRLIAVTLDAPNDWKDHTRLYDYGFSKLKYIKLCDISDVYSLYVTGGDKTCVLVRPAETSELLVEYNGKEPTSVVELPKFMYAPVSNGQKVGKLVYHIGQKEIARIDLVVCESAQRIRNSKTILDKIKNFLEDLWQNLSAFKNTSQTADSALAEAPRG